MQFNVKNQKKFVYELTPKGLYPAIVESVEYGESAKGNPQLVWTFVLDLDADNKFDGRKLKVWTVLPNPDDPTKTAEQLQFAQNNLNKYLFGFASILGVEIPDPNAVVTDEELENLDVEDEENELTLEKILELLPNERCIVNIDVVAHWNKVPGEKQNVVLGTLPIDSDD